MIPYSRIDYVRIISYSFLILISFHILISWAGMLNVRINKKFCSFVYYYTEPILSRLRFPLPVSIPLDLSPILAFLIITEIEKLAIHIVTLI